MIDSENLALRYRPRTFDDVVGQRATKLILSKMVAKRRVPTGLLFYGNSGSGKTSAARILAAALNCTGPADEAPPCGNCVSCKAVFSGTSLDVIEIDAASNGSVANIRELCELLRYNSGGNYRALVLDEAHALSREAYYALLKILEEPPENTVFIFCTTEPHRILDTIHSRLMSFQFRNISSADVLGRLQYINAQDSLHVEEALLSYLANGASSLRDAIMTLDQMSRIGVTKLSQYQKLTNDVDVVPQILDAMCVGDIEKMFELVDEQLHNRGDANLIFSHLVRHLRVGLVAASVAPERGCAPAGSPNSDAMAWGADLDVERLYRSMKLCWETQKLNIKDSRSSLELLCVLLAETLSGRKNLVGENKKMSLTQMSQM